MSDELRRLEDRLNSKLQLQFELYNQGMTMLRDNVGRRIADHEQQTLQLMQSALAAQRGVIEDALQQQQQLTNRSFEEIRGALLEAFSSLDERLTRLEKKAG